MPYTLCQNEFSTIYALVNSLSREIFTAVTFSILSKMYIDIDEGTKLIGVKNEVFMQ